MKSDHDIVHAARAELAALRAEIDQLVRRLRALGIKVAAAEENPADELSGSELERLREKLTALAAKQAAAAKTRAKKLVGTGSGRVSSKALQKRLRDESEQAEKKRGRK